MQISVLQKHITSYNPKKLSSNWFWVICLCKCFNEHCRDEADCKRKKDKGNDIDKIHFFVYS